jgi:hypothetical protein
MNFKSRAIDKKIVALENNFSTTYQDFQLELI